MLTKTDLQKTKEILDPRFDRIEQKLEEHDEKFKSIDIRLDVEFEYMHKKFEEIDGKFEDHRKRIMTLQDVVVRIDKYIHGELAVILRNHEGRIEKLESHILD